MKIETFANETELDKKKILNKCIYIAFYLKIFEEQNQFKVDEIADIFEQLHYSRPNSSRLKGSLTKSRSFVKGNSSTSFKLHSKEIKKLGEEHPDLSEKTEEIITGDTILPESLYTGTRGFIEALAKQINSSYENNVFDGCAVLMRRLLEIMLILTYEHLGLGAEIKNSDGSYMLLKGIVSNATSDNKLELSRNSKESLDPLRIVGNFSAHKIYYNAKRKDITNVSIDFRATIEELLYKSGVKK